VAGNFFPSQRQAIRFVLFHREIFPLLLAANSDYAPQVKFSVRPLCLGGESLLTVTHHRDTEDAQRELGFRRLPPFRKA